MTLTIYLERWERLELCNAKIRERVFAVVRKMGITSYRRYGCRRCDRPIIAQILMALSNAAHPSLSPLGDIRQMSDFTGLGLVEHDPTDTWKRINLDVCRT